MLTVVIRALVPNEAAMANWLRLIDACPKAVAHLPFSETPQVGTALSTLATASP